MKENWRLDWIIKIGDGKLGLEIDGIAEVEIPNDLLVLESQNPLSYCGLYLSRYVG